MGQQTIPEGSISKTRRVLAGCLLAALLLQIGMFFIGLLVPVRRIEMLWGKSFADRQMAVCQPARILTQIADQFPMDARIYLMDPQLLLHWNSVYFFYPRLVTVTMTDHSYRSQEAYAAWNERPTDDWLISHGFTYVLSYKNGLQVRQLQSAAHTKDDASR
jgi:hypothetical protein